jgi:short subunit dehydrogenase-like uncharacterized protein
VDARPGRGGRARAGRGRRAPAASAGRGGVLVYGATGYTGALVARAAAARALPAILAGRSAARVAPLAAALALPARVAPLAGLAEALDGVAVVVNAAGPFSKTAESMVRACIAAGVHYLDISGEVDSIEAVSRYDGAARAAGVMLMPAVGFDVVPSDCLAARVSRRLPDARHLRIGLSGLELASRGSARTIFEQMGKGVRVRHNGDLGTVPEGLLESGFDFGEGVRACTGVSWGDVVTAHHTTGIPNVEVYFDATPAVRAFQLFGRSVGAFPPAAALSELWMRPWIESQPEGPTEGARARQRAAVVAVAESASGRRVASRAYTPEVYTFTATSASTVAARVLAGDVAPGFQTPGRLFGESFIESFDGVTVEDLWLPEERRGRP